MLMQMLLLMLTPMLLLQGVAGRQLQLDAEMVDSKERQVGEREAAVWLGRMMAIFLEQMDHGHIVKADQKVRS